MKAQHKPKTQVHWRQTAERSPQYRRLWDILLTDIFRDDKDHSVKKRQKDSEARGTQKENGAEGF